MDKQVQASIQRCADIDRRSRDIIERSTDRYNQAIANTDHLIQTCDRLDGLLRDTAEYLGDKLDGIEPKLERILAEKYWPDLLTDRK